MAKKKKGKGDVISVDFTGVKGSNRVPEGEYKVKVVAITMEEGESSGQPYLKWELEITEGKQKGKKLVHITSLQPQALFNLRNTLEALGVEVEEKAMKLNLNDYIGLEMGVVVEIETYQGNARSRVVDVFNLNEIEDEDDDESDDDSDDEDEGDDEDDDDEDDEDEDDEDEDDEDDEDELTEEDLEDLDDDELVEKAKEYGVEVTYSNKKKKKLDRKVMIEAILEAAAGDDEEDEDDEGELTEEDLEAMDDDELIEKAEEVGAKVVKKKKKLDRKATIKNILDALGE